MCVCVCARAGQEKKDDKWQKGQTSPVRDEATGNKYNTFNIIFKERAHLRRAPNLWCTQRISICSFLQVSFLVLFCLDIIMLASLNKLGSIFSLIFWKMLCRIAILSFLNAWYNSVNTCRSKSFFVGRILIIITISSTDTGLLR